MTNTFTARRIAVAGLIGAAYLTLCAALPMLSFGQIQVRFAEVFTLLPLFTPAGIWGVTIGCALSNIYGLALGTNIIGIWDIFFGLGGHLPCRPAHLPFPPCGMAGPAGVVGAVSGAAQRAGGGGGTHRRHVPGF